MENGTRTRQDKGCWHIPTERSGIGGPHGIDTASEAIVTQHGSGQQGRRLHHVRAVAALHPHGHTSDGLSLPLLPRQLCSSRIARGTRNTRITRILLVLAWSRRVRGRGTCIRTSAMLEIITTADTVDTGGDRSLILDYCIRVGRLLLLQLLVVVGAS